LFDFGGLASRRRKHLLTDFTVTVGPDDMRAFRQARFDIEALTRKRIRVRGWVEFYNGPEITIVTPGAIEVLE
jgi:hypothetical protein